MIRTYKLPKCHPEIIYPHHKVHHDHITAAGSVPSPNVFGSLIECMHDTTDNTSNALDLNSLSLGKMVCSLLCPLTQPAILNGLHASDGSLVPGSNPLPYKIGFSHFLLSLLMLPLLQHLTSINIAALSSMPSFII